jgi:hypothetical protein
VVEVKFYSFSMPLRIYEKGCLITPERISVKINAVEIGFNLLL